MVRLKLRVVNRGYLRLKNSRDLKQSKHEFNLSLVHNIFHRFHKHGFTINEIVVRTRLTKWEVRKCIKELASMYLHSIEVRGSVNYFHCPWLRGKWVQYPIKFHHDPRYK